MASTDLPELLTSTEAAVRLGVSRETIRRWAATKRLRHVKMPSGRLRFRPEDIDAVFDPVEVEAGA